MCRLALAVEREVFGAVPKEVTNTLKVLARLAEGKGDWADGTHFPCGL
jgi:hypothetical protein